MIVWHESTASKRKSGHHGKQFEGKTHRSKPHTKLLKSLAPAPRGQGPEEHHSDSLPPARTDLLAISVAVAVKLWAAFDHVPVVNVQAPAAIRSGIAEQGRTVIYLDRAACLRCATKLQHFRIGDAVAGTVGRERGDQIIRITGAKKSQPG